LSEESIFSCGLSPATELTIVVTFPHISILRIRLEPVSAIYMFFFESIAIPFGEVNKLCVIFPSVEPAVVVPARVITNGTGVEEYLATTFVGDGGGTVFIVKEVETMLFTTFVYAPDTVYVNTEYVYAPSDKSVYPNVAIPLAFKYPDESRTPFLVT